MQAVLLGVFTNYGGNQTMGFTIEEWNLMSLEERVEEAWSFYTSIKQTAENFHEVEALLNLLQNLRGC